MRCGANHLHVLTTMRHIVCFDDGSLKYIMVIATRYRLRESVFSGYDHTSGPLA